MYIQTKYRIGTGITILMGMLLLLSVHLISKEIRYNLNAETQALTISERLAEMQALSADYIAYPRERIIRQWAADIASLKTVLLKARQDKYIDLQVLQKLEDQLDVMDGFMRRLVEVKAGGATSNDAKFYNRTVEAIAGRLREEVRLTFDISLNLAHDHRVAVTDYIDQTRYFYSSLIILMLLMAILASIWVGKTILAPINNLRKQTHLITRGHLGRRINSDTKDEIGLLSKDFDIMTDNLQRTMISRDELEATVLDRTREMKTAKDLAEKASESKTRFLSGMSHELRTPLNAVLGFAQILEMHEGLDEMSRDSVNEILGAGRHLLSLIDDVLDITRIDQDRIAFEISDVSVSGAVNTAVNFLVDTANIKGVMVESRIDQALFVRTDVVRFKQVMINIISNAIKYNKKGGWVKIYSEKAAAGMVDICVADSGEGIPEEMYEKVLEPFERHSSDPYSVEGLGIGLAIVKRLVDVMGGELSFVSSLGKGSTFRVRLKLAE